MQMICFTRPKEAGKMLPVFYKCFFCNRTKNSWLLLKPAVSILWLPANDELGQWEEHISLV